MTMSPAPSNRWYYSLWFVLLMLFFVLGPLGLPLLWKSPHMTRGAKWLLTITVSAYTVALAAASWHMVQTVVSTFPNPF